MRRVVTLINQLATLHSTSAALQVQADSNNQAAKKYMENNELLQQVRLYAFNRRLDMPLLILFTHKILTLLFAAVFQ